MSTHKVDWHQKKKANKERKRHRADSAPPRWRQYANKMGHLDYRRDQATNKLSKAQKKAQGSVRAEIRSLISNNNINSYHQLPYKQKIFNPEEKQNNNNKNDIVIDEKQQNDLNINKFAIMNKNWNEKNLDYQQWAQYHTKYRRIYKKWDVKPVELAIDSVKNIIQTTNVSNIRIADLGCGEAQILKRFYDDIHLDIYDKNPIIQYQYQIYDDIDAVHMNDNKNNKNKKFLKQNLKRQRSKSMDDGIKTETKTCNMRIDSYDLYSTKKNIKYIINCDFGNLKQIGIEDDCYDIIICCLSLQSKINQKLKEINRIIKVNGYLLIWQPHSMKTELMEHINSDNFKNQFNIVDVTDINRFVQVFLQKQQTDTK